jgi:hypothetical protein
LEDYNNHLKQCFVKKQKDIRNLENQLQILEKEGGEKAKCRSVIQHYVLDVTLMRMIVVHAPIQVAYYQSVKHRIDLD